MQTTSRAYHAYLRENDLCLTHTFGHPQVNRAVPVGELPDPHVALGVVDTTGDGVIVRGAKLLATLAPFSNEILAPVYRPLRPDVPGDRKYCIGFAILANAPGLKFICRESYDLGASLYDYPLSGQYDEMDALAVFDDVLVPWDRVFAFDDVELANQNLQRAPMWRQYMQQVAVKNIAKPGVHPGDYPRNCGVHRHHRLPPRSGEDRGDRRHPGDGACVHARGRGRRRPLWRRRYLARSGAVDRHAPLVSRMPTSGSSGSWSSLRRAG